MTDLHRGHPLERRTVRVLRIARILVANGHRGAEDRVEPVVAAHPRAHHQRSKDLRALTRTAPCLRDQFNRTLAINAR
ncbi:hypothetical protein ACIBCN_02690 [Nocardia sp. NPDC051052]|uniref:hypothetical protein n=1 Tax=Nocardia sp. NPDC051052 TaxID=3364322 RepID=UPI0037AF063E